MSPTQPQTMEQPTILINGQALPGQPERVQTTQPKVLAPMGMLTLCSVLFSVICARANVVRSCLADPQRPHADDDANIRGGDRGGLCPGRFCFIIPCPLPCDCCII